MEVETSGDIDILISSGYDVDFIAWGPFTDLAAACSSIPDHTSYPDYYPHGKIVDCSYSAASVETAHIPDAVAGEVYVLLITNYSNQETNITFAQTGGTGTTNCDIIAPPVTNNGPLCVGQTIELSVTFPVTGATYAWTGPNNFTSSAMNPTIPNANPNHTGTYSLIITVDGVASEPETTEVVVNNPQSLTTVSTGDFVFRNNGDDWNDASNWLKYTAADTYSVSLIVPTASDNVIICAGPTCASNDAIVSTTDAICKSLIIETGCVLTMQGSHNLTVHSNWINDGTYNPGTGTVVFNNNTTISGATTSHDFHSITINASKTLTAPASNINVRGNWTNSGTFIHNSGTISFIGNNNQNITSGPSGEFYNLTVQNTSSGVSLIDDASVLNILKLSDGVVSTGSNYLISRGIFANSIVGFTDQSFIYGNLRKFISNNTTYELPIGKGINSTDYHRADIISNITGGTSSIAASVTSIVEQNTNIDANLTAEQNSTPLLDALGENAIWTIIPDGVPTGSYGIRLYVKNTGITAADDNTFCVLKRNGGSTTYADWQTYEASTVIPVAGLSGRIHEGGNGYAQRTGYTSFSEFTIAKGNTPLPVNLLTFTANCLKTSANIHWQTASETNNDYFILEKSKDVSEFYEIARIKGAGNSNILVDYNFVDHKMFSGENYYRLKQVDFDGKTTTYNIINLNCDGYVKGQTIMYAYPNPFKDELNVVIENMDKGEFTLEILDDLGRVVYLEKCTAVSSEYRTSLKLNDLRPAVYNLRSKSNDNVLNVRVVKR